MKLTTEQIDYIEHTLVKNGLDFEDLKFELIDHIASATANAYNLYFGSDFRF